MSAPISVIIPTLNAAAVIGPLLADLTEAVVAGLVREVIIVDGGSGDDIAQLAEGCGAVFHRTDPGRGGQLAAGAALAKGEWLLFLHADSRLSPGWLNAVQDHLHGTSAGWFHLRFADDGWAARWVAGWANWRARWLGLPFGDQGLLISATLYRTSGGHPPLPIMEDVALARRLRGQWRPLRAQIITSATRYQHQGWWRRGARNLWLQLLYFCGADPQRLARAYAPGQTAISQQRGKP